jgi:Rps23 Pro-64 3,4-dihydroxylase Tpa1-like proline 4-hydroxylase
MINPELDIEKLHEEFKEQKSIEVINFLEDGIANRMYDFLNGGMDETWWSASFLAHNTNNGQPIHLRRIPSNEEEIIKMEGIALGSFETGAFSYYFDRTTNHKEACNCTFCQFRWFLHSPEVLNLIRTVTGEEVSQSQEVFASRFVGTQFLSPHHDLNKGKIGFVYSLTREWKTQHGGNLHLMKYDYKTVTKVITPKFNRLTMFHIPSNDGIPHFVSHVVPGIKTKRLSITGWFS